MNAIERGDEGVAAAVLFALATVNPRGEFVPVAVWEPEPIRRALWREAEQRRWPMRPTEAWLDRDGEVLVGWESLPLVWQGDNA